MTSETQASSRDIKVSVCVVSYNQKESLHKCLTSLVNQGTNFNYEIIVGDDASTDGTADVVNEFAACYPNIIVPVLHPSNRGPFENYKSVHRLASGEYVAHLDGDDTAYPGKLREQATYLDAHEHCALVAHRMDVWDGSRVVGCTRKNPENIGLPCLLARHPMFLNSSMMYRRRMVGAVFETTADFIDFYVYVYAAKQGRLCFLNESLGRYTQHVGMSSRSDLMTYIQNAIDLATGSASESVIRAARSKQYLSYAIRALLSRDQRTYASYVALAWQCHKSNMFVLLFHVLRKRTRVLRMLIVTFKAVQLRVGVIGRMLTVFKS